MSLNEARQRKRLKLKFEATSDTFVTVEGMQAEEIFGCIIPYRDWMVDNLAGHRPLDPTTFVRWMESADRSVMSLPAEYGNRFFEALDEVLIEAVREDGMQPGEVVDVLDKWVEESKREFIETHDAPENFFVTEDADLGGGD